MPKFNVKVCIRAALFRTIEIEAENDQAAEAIAEDEAEEWECQFKCGEYLVDFDYVSHAHATEI